MYTMSVRSPSGMPAPATGAVPFATGRLSPVSSDSATSSVAALSSLPVRRNDITRLDRDDIAGDQLCSGDLRLLAIAPHPGGHDQPPLERGDRALGLALLLQAENRVSQCQQNQQKAGSQLPEGEEAEEADH